MLLVAPVVGALIIWGIWQASRLLLPSTTTVIVEAPRPTATPLPPTALPPFLVQPTVIPVPAAPTPPLPTSTSAVVVNPEPSVAPPTIASPAVAAAPPAAVSPSPVVAVAPGATPVTAASPGPVRPSQPAAAASPPPVGPTAAIAAAPTAAPQPIEIIHVVEAGETIARIAQRYGVQPDAILRANGLSERTRTLRIGDRLLVPGVTATPAPLPPPVRAAAPTRTPTPAPTAAPDETRVYIAEAGDSLSRIAERYGVSLDALLQANGFDDPDRVLRIGERVIIPDSDEPPPP
jgi:LysM repeat protein